MSVTRILPVSLRSWSGVRQLVQTLHRNVSGELTSAHRGVRRLHLWREDPQFLDLLQGSSDVSMLTLPKQYCLYQVALNAISVPGDFAELGVYRGGSAWLLAEILKRAGSEKTLHLFDTFSGLPGHDASLDRHQKGDLSETTLETVQRLLTGFDKVEFHAGLFSETLAESAPASLSFVHVDADLYTSVFESCEGLYDRMAPGGSMLFDDYGFISCPGAKTAVDTFFKDRIEVPIYLATGQCMVCKR